MDRVTFEEFREKFANEAACVAAFEKLKWPEGFRCPRCSHRHAYPMRSRRLPLYECRNCGHQTSLIAGTVLEGSRVPLRLWFQAIFLHAQPAGISAVRLSRMLGVTYKTAWLMGHKIRHAMSLKDKMRKLAGLIRITPGRYGRAYNATSCRHPQEHPILIASSFAGNGQAEYVKIKQVLSEDIPYRTVEYSGLEKFMKSHVNSETSEVISDLRRPIGERSRILTQIGRTASEWLNATFRGIGPKHLQAYLDQFCFSVNLRFQNEAFSERGLSACAEMNRITLRELVARPALTPVTPEYDRVMAMYRAARKTRLRRKSAS